MRISQITTSHRARETVQRVEEGVHVAWESGETRHCAEYTFAYERTAVMNGAAETHERLYITPTTNFSTPTLADMRGIPLAFENGRLHEVVRDKDGTHFRPAESDGLHALVIAALQNITDPELRAAAEPCLKRYQGRNGYSRS
jgi:hypothetical protein